MFLKFHPPLASFRKSPQKIWDLTPHFPSKNHQKQKNDENDSLIDVCTYAYMCKYVCVYVYVNVYVCICKCIWTCICMYIDILVMSSQNSPWATIPPSSPISPSLPGRVVVPRKAHRIRGERRCREFLHIFQASKRSSKGSGWPFFCEVLAGP